MSRSVLRTWRGWFVFVPVQLLIWLWAIPILVSFASDVMMLLAFVCAGGSVYWGVYEYQQHKRRKEIAAGAARFDRILESEIEDARRGRPPRGGII